MKKLKTFENLKLNNPHLGEIDKKKKLGKIFKFNEIVKKNTAVLNSNKFSISPIFLEINNDEDSITNHSFASEIHLKNNKNFIPKDQICPRNMRGSFGRVGEISNMGSKN